MGLQHERHLLGRHRRHSHDGVAPGDEKTAHTVNDSVPLDDVVKSAAFYAILPALISAELMWDWGQVRSDREKGIYSLWISLDS